LAFGKKNKKEKKKRKEKDKLEENYVTLIFVLSLPFPYSYISPTQQILVPLLNQYSFSSLLLDVLILSNFEHLD
jgi:hypothetical protein